LTLYDPDAGDLPPSLHWRYPASALLRSSPAPELAHRYFRPRGSSARAFSLTIASQVLKFRTKARNRFTPPEHRTSHGQYVGFFHALPGARGRPRFRCHLGSFRCVIGGSFAFVSLSHTWRG